MRGTGDPASGRRRRRRGGRRHRRRAARCSPRSSAGRRTTARAPTVSLTVHYGRDYDNAFWDGTQLVFGDGDGEIFDRFTKPVDVLGHELTHAVTEHTAGLRYQDQSGALNESVSDVFGSCLKQWLLGQTVDEADWLIGAGPVPARRRRRAGCATWPPRHGLRRPAARARTRRAPRWTTTSTPTTTTAACTSTPASPTAPSTWPRPRSAAASWEGAGAIWYAALTGGQVGADDRLRRVRGRDRRRGGRARRRGAPGLGDGRRHARRRLDVDHPPPPAPGAERDARRSCGVRAASPAAPPRARSTSTSHDAARARGRAPWSTASTCAHVRRRRPAPRHVRLRLRPLRSPRRRCPSSTSPPTSAGSPTSSWMLGDGGP